jgi:hypothetical protein
MATQTELQKNQFIEIGSLVFVKSIYNKSYSSKLTKYEVLNACRESLRELCGNYFSSSVEEKDRIGVQLDYINHVCDVIAIFPEGLSLTRDDIIGSLWRFSKSDLVPNSYSVN